MGLYPNELKDKSIREAYEEHFDPAKPFKPLGPKALAEIIQAALDGKRVTPRERRDLEKILAEAALTDAARKSLEEFAARNVRFLRGKRRREIAEVVSGTAYVGDIDFAFGPNEYNPAAYAYIGKQILDGGIDVYEHAYDEDKERPSTNYGVYYSHEDQLFVARIAGRTKFERFSTVVHEATHALQDKQNKAIKRFTAEAAAHIAQAVMLIKAAAYDESYLYGRLKKDGIKNAAWKVIDGGGRKLTKKDRDDARQVIAESKFYKSKGNSIRPFHTEWYSVFESLAYWLGT